MSTRTNLSKYNKLIAKRLSQGALDLFGDVA